MGGDKSKPVSKQRRTFARQIKTLASKDVSATALLAKRGRQFTQIEAKLELYYHPPKHEMSGEVPAEILKAMTKANLAGEKLRVFLSVDLRRIFMEAVDARDSKTIFEIGNAVAFLKTFNESGDRYRSGILFLKMALDKQSLKWPIRQLAHVIGWPDMSGMDGFKNLRVMCKELKFPLAPSRQIRNR